MISEARIEQNITGNWRGKKVAAIVRFESKLRPQPDGCVHFDGHHDRDGYPHFSVNGKSVRASRFIFARHHALEDRDCVLHSCDNPRCVSIAHLWKGSTLDNNRDRARKGRSARSTPGSGRFNAPRDTGGRFIPS